MPMSNGTRLIDARGNDVTDAVFGQIHKMWKNISDPSDPNSIRKAGEVITTAQNLVAIDLEAPSKGLYPVLTPLRNAIPRVTRATGAGVAAQWKEVTSINGANALPISPWLREGQRAAKMQVATADRSAPYVTIGLDTDVTFEAQSAASGFEDEYAMSATRLLQQVMIQEEAVILGGNRSVQLGTTATPTLTASGTGGTLPAATYSVRVFGLTYEGWRNTRGNITPGIFRQVTLTGADNQTYTVNGGSSAAGTASTQAVTLGQTLFASVPALPGALAYAWFVGTAGNERLERITTINSVAMNTPLLATGQTLASISDPTIDRSFNDGSSGNNAPAFNGLIYAVYASPLARKMALPTGVAGTGSTLTASGRGTILEIDNELRVMWDFYRITPEVIWCNAQEINTIANKIFGGTVNGTLRYSVALNPDGELIAGVNGIQYMNLFGMGGNPTIPIRVHPDLTPGTMAMWTNNLPVQYQSADVPQVTQVQCRREYYQIPWPQTTRRQETGVYVEETLKVYAPFALNVLTNIAPG